MLKSLLVILLLSSFSAFAGQQVSAKVLQQINIGTEKNPEKALLVQVRVKDETRNSQKIIYRTYIIKQDGFCFDLTNAKQSPISISLRIQSVLNTGNELVKKKSFIAHITVTKSSPRKIKTQVSTILINDDGSIQSLVE
ncbi:MAG: hypothetical protein AB7I27_12040 [Bacteriovoracaceae bacterium]